MARDRRGWRVSVMTAVLIAALPAGASAHDTKMVGPLRVTIGWAEEPAFTGSRNAVVVTLADNAGPLKAPAASLSVEIAFGSERITLPLEPVQPHELRAWLVPTRAGTYTFHVTGKVRSQAVDVTSTCSESTFHCVADASQIQFPAKDPSAGQLADRLGRVLPRADAASERAGRALGFALAALAVAGLALAASIGAIVLGRRRSV